MSEKESKITPEEIEIAERALEAARKNPLRIHSKTAAEYNEDDDDMAATILMVPVIIGALALVKAIELKDQIEEITSEKWHRIKQLLNPS